MTEDRGFALLALLLSIAAASSLLLASLPLLEPVDRSLGRETWARLAKIRSHADSALRETGSLPATLDALAAIRPIADTDVWRRDPFSADDFGYTVAGTPSMLTLTSVGLDRRTATADDVTLTLDATADGRARSRARLRTLRAAFLRSVYMHAGGMSAGDEAAMRSHLHTYATSQRGIAFATGTERTALIAQRDDARASILSLRATYLLPAPPSQVSGPGGLLASLALPDSLDADGFGNPLVANDAVGCVSVGPDGIGDTDDDL